MMLRVGPPTDGDRDRRGDGDLEHISYGGRLKRSL